MFVYSKKKVSKNIPHIRELCADRYAHPFGEEINGGDRSNV
jgi:hypothetical protein